MLHISKLCKATSFLMQNHRANAHSKMFIQYSLLSHSKSSLFISYHYVYYHYTPKHHILMREDLQFIFSIITIVMPSLFDKICHSFSNHNRRSMCIPTDDSGHSETM